MRDWDGATICGVVAQHQGLSPTHPISGILESLSRAQHPLDISPGEFLVSLLFEICHGNVKSSGYGCWWGGGAPGGQGDQEICSLINEGRRIHPFVGTGHTSWSITREANFLPQYLLFHFSPSQFENHKSPI